VGGEDVTGAHPAGLPAMTVPSAVDPDSRPVESPPPRVDQGPGRTGRPAPRWWSLSLPGSWGALLLVCASLTPSLLPRSGVAQGVVSGISAAMGYGLGVLAAAVWRALADPLFAQALLANPEKALRDVRCTPHQRWLLQTIRAPTVRDLAVELEVLFWEAHYPARSAWAQLTRAAG
jgi:uncharacterized membrane protein